MSHTQNHRGGIRPGAGRKKKTPEGTYEHVTFSADQLKELTSNPNVAYVSCKSVSYTKKFKEDSWKKYCNGEDPIQIFKESGFNTETLGTTRIVSFFKLLRQAKEKGLAFTEGSEPYPTDATKKYSFPTPPRRANKGRPPVMSDSEITKLAVQVAYMSQELAFLKKIILAETQEK